MIQWIKKHVLGIRECSNCRAVAQTIRLSDTEEVYFQVMQGMINDPRLFVGLNRSYLCTACWDRFCQWMGVANY